MLKATLTGYFLIAALATLSRDMQRYLRSATLESSAEKSAIQTERKSAKNASRNSCDQKLFLISFSTKAFSKGKF